MKCKLSILAFLLAACVAIGETNAPALAPAQAPPIAPASAKAGASDARIDRLEAKLKQVAQLAIHLQGLVQQSKKNIGLVGAESVAGNSTEDGGGIIDDLALNDLSDVVIVNPQKYQVLTYDGSVWTNDWVRWE